MDHERYIRLKPLEDALALKAKAYRSLKFRACWWRIKGAWSVLFSKSVICYTSKTRVKSNMTHVGDHDFGFQINTYTDGSL
jgi:hypothetical protein